MKNEESSSDLQKYAILAIAIVQFQNQVKIIMHARHFPNQPALRRPSVRSRAPTAQSCQRHPRFPLRRHAPSRTPQRKTIHNQTNKPNAKPRQKSKTKKKKNNISKPINQVTPSSGEYKSRSTRRAHHNPELNQLQEIHRFNTSKKKKREKITNLPPPFPILLCFFPSSR
ncbi:hypothetical protein L873DRAFT_673698 [Choiromyces venosus 120613-1]|uniref:Uncharacterized protein n=1 Tax=Choiromyces venosus 120613-1 TaxID=1336337 RepID=A0A3N4JWA6_9PEZI|nr:hypothetical protein L873DRAFT_673698 [Choiromyces venosus 120613-1]